jgi:hypothetical protein
MSEAVGVERRGTVSSHWVPQASRAEAPPDDQEPTAWDTLKARFVKPDPRPDYGTGYYVRSTAHPVVGGPGADMPLSEIFSALDALDDAYSVDDSK